MPPKRAPKLSRTSSPASIGGDSEAAFSEISDSADSVSLTDSESLLEVALAKFVDRRASNRLEALEMFNRQLCLQLHEEFLQREMVTIQTGVLSSLKRNLPHETVHVCRFVQLITLTIGSGADRLLNEAVPALFTLSRHGDAKVRPAAIRALATIQLVTCQHVDALQHWMLTFSRFFMWKDADVASAAIDAWALVATRLSNERLPRFVQRQYLPRLAALLHSRSLEVRTSTGEAMALIFAAVWQRRQSADDIDTSDDNVESEQDKGLAETGDESISEVDSIENDNELVLESSEDFDIDEVQELLSHLATDGTRSRSRKDRLLQRSVFRSVELSVSSGEEPKVVLKMGKERLTFATWKSIIRLSALRDVLAQGFYRHISSNELVRNLLLIRKEQSESIGRIQIHPDSVSVEPKEISQAKTKMRQQKKKTDRNHKHSFQFNAD